MKIRHGWFGLGIIGALLFLGACDDDEKTTVVYTPNWIGNACSCEGPACDILGVPFPAPNYNESVSAQGSAVISGCENVDPTPIPGAALACLKTITLEIAPPAYAPQGYCTVSAVKCEGGDAICDMVNYGNPDLMQSCPVGSTMLVSKFPTKILGQELMITNKTCAKNCETDADCNVAGEMTCLEHDGAKFCYNSKNFDFMTNGFQAIPFN